MDIFEMKNVLTHQINALDKISKALEGTIKQKDNVDKINRSIASCLVETTVAIEFAKDAIAEINIRMKCGALKAIQEIVEQKLL